MRKMMTDKALVCIFLKSYPCYNSRDELLWWFYRRLEDFQLVKPWDQQQQYAVTKLVLWHSIRFANLSWIIKLSSLALAIFLLNLQSSFRTSFVLLQMTVVETLVGFGGMMSQSPDDCDTLSKSLVSLLIEGIAHNTTGNVFEPEVSRPFVWLKFTFLMLDNSYTCSEEFFQKMK